MYYMYLILVAIEAYRSARGSDTRNGEEVEILD